MRKTAAVAAILGRQGPGHVRSTCVRSARGTATRCDPRRGARRSRGHLGAEPCRPCARHDPRRGAGAQPGRRQSRGGSEPNALADTSNGNGNACRRLPGRRPSRGLHDDPQHDRRADSGDARSDHQRSGLRCPGNRARSRRKQSGWGFRWGALSPRRVRRAVGRSGCWPSSAAMQGAGLGRWRAGKPEQRLGVTPFWANTWYRYRLRIEPGQVSPRSGSTQRPSHQSGPLSTSHHRDRNCRSPQATSGS